LYTLAVFFRVLPVSSLSTVTDNGTMRELDSPEHVDCILFG
jgi:hypothetical protein